MATFHTDALFCNISIFVEVTATQNIDFNSDQSVELGWHFFYHKYIMVNAKMKKIQNSIKEIKFCIFSFEGKYYSSSGMLKSNRTSCANNNV